MVVYPAADAGASYIELFSTSQIGGALGDA
jgi:hypothetical protein